MTDARATRDYSARSDDELTFRVGDVITGVKQFAPGWCEGMLKDRRGIFPTSFVAPVAPMAKSVGRGSSPNAREKQNVAVKGGSGGVSELRSKLSGVIGAAGRPGGTRGLTVEGKHHMGVQLARVTRAYSAQAEDELSLEVGMVFDVLRTDCGDEGWWEGRINNKIGLFPSAFVEDVSALNDDETMSEESAKTKGNATAEGAKTKGRKLVGGVGFGNIFSGDPIVLRSTKADRRNVAVPAVQLSEGLPDFSLQQTKALPLMKSERLHAKVLYPYTAVKSDELTLAEGQVITVLDQNLLEAGWWSGELDGRIGVFPENFVCLIPTPAPILDGKAKKKFVVTNLPSLPNAVYTASDFIKRDEPKKEMREAAKATATPKVWVGKKKLAKIPMSLGGDEEHVEFPAAATNASPDRFQSPTPPHANRLSPLDKNQLQNPPKSSTHDRFPSVRLPDAPAVAGKRDAPAFDTRTDAVAPAPGLPSPFSRAVPLCVGFGTGLEPPAESSPAQCTDMRREVAQLREVVESTRQAQERHLVELKGQIEEGRRGRMVLQTEVDRLKKFLDSK